MEHYDIVIIGGGPTGLAAAVSAYDAGTRSILILEREERLGGILNQCIHPGFGLHTFHEELTGPEYAQRFADEVLRRDIDCKLGTMVLHITPDKTITAISPREGLLTLRAKAIVLAMGCRERSRGALNIPGYRPAGVYSAGAAQHLVNIEGKLPGKRVVILGSGDIGLIVARRMTLEGAQVVCVAELMPYSGGLRRNIVQCLDDFGIPLLLSHTVVNIRGRERLEGVTLAQVDGNLRPIPGTEAEHDCDTLLLSCGLIPENELSREMGVGLNAVTNGPVVNESLETTVPGVFAAGNVLHVHDLVDFVSQEAAEAGRRAAAYVAGSGGEPRRDIPVEFSGGVRYTVPAKIDPTRVKDTQIIRFRVGSVMKNRTVSVYLDGERVMSRRRSVMAPGEMEEVRLSANLFRAHPGAQRLQVCIEEVEA